MYNNFGFTFLLTFILFGISLVVCDILSNVTDYSEIEDDLSSSRLLSRRKRFIIFPDGSSFQLVFCTQTHGYLQIGDIVWFGNTAALAWELPSDPLLFYYFNDAKKVAAQRRTDPAKHIYYLNESGKVIAKVPYKKRPIVNPAFAKRSVTDKEDNEETKKLFIKKMHDLQKNLSHFKNLDAASVEFHREGRRSLYAKLEKFMEAMGWRGRECVLQMLCGAGKSGGEHQGTFLEEILRAVFTLPQGRDFSLEKDKQYDIAHGAGLRDDCAKLYPECNDLYGFNRDKQLK